MTALALASAARLPVLTPAASQTLSIDLREIDDVASPAIGNVTAWSGEMLTAAFSQWREGDHFVVFTDPAATAMYEEFFVTTVQGEPTIVSVDDQ